MTTTPQQILTDALARVQQDPKFVDLNAVEQARQAAELVMADSERQSVRLSALQSYVCGLGAIILTMTFWYILIARPEQVQTVLFATGGFFLLVLTGRYLIQHRKNGSKMKLIGDGKRSDN
ncbi:hypothetical protein ACEN2T_17775 [Pseudomonas sp. W22_MBD1_FP4]|uniref:hypothetical protein n=1 Tax=Pseudomonas sp. W22_MBD1_FP4 TaxID=3240272 RepID=UPI003F9E1A3A